MNAKELSHFPKGTIHLVPHPPAKPFNKLKSSTRIAIKNVAIVGLIRPENKDIDRINQFAALASDRGIRVCAIGRQYGNAGLSKDIVDHTVSHHYSESMVEARLESIDAILCIYMPDRYRLTASGGASDWLSYGKPGLFLRHPCFDSLNDWDIPVVIKGTPTELVEEISSRRFSFSKEKSLIFHRAMSDRFEIALKAFIDS
jgi:hypothetical protein